MVWFYLFGTVAIVAVTPLSLLLLLLASESAWDEDYPTDYYKAKWEEDAFWLNTLVMALV